MDLFKVYPIYDVEIAKAKGSFVWDKKGTKYLDMYGGHAVISIGHTQRNYVKAISSQLKKVGFYSNSVDIPLQRELAEKLGKLSNYESYSFFFCNSGAEANENALKLASFHTGKKKVIVFTNGFHGRTSLAVAATDNPSIVAPINETDHFVKIPFNDSTALQKHFTNDVAAVMFEPFQGVGGIFSPTTEFMEEVQALCSKKKALLIADEVQSGYGRTGKFFGHQHFNVKPDIITVAKGMGNGFPIGGVLISPEIEAKFGLLGTTFGGNHLACAAGIAVLTIIEKKKLIRNSQRMGDYLKEELKKILQVKEVRGEGLMLGIELDKEVAPIRKRLVYDYQIFTGASSNKNTIRLLPPMTITKKEITVFLDAFERVLKYS
ncbi:MAG: aspartate aminotransferase family protein [Cyclobacteriaceae bacterium]